MNFLLHHLSRVFPLVTAALVLSACGGGGNESGPPDSIELSATSVTVTGSSTSCAVGPGPQVFIYGGQPPYRVNNPYPQGMTLSTSTVGDSGKSFGIQFLGACMSAVAIPIEDNMGRTAILTVNNVAGS